MKRIAKTKRKLLIFGAVTGLVIVGVVVTIFALSRIGTDNNAANDPYIQREENDATESLPQDDGLGELSDAGTEPASPAENLDPESVSSVAIEPLGIVVSYVKGIAGFEYAIYRTNDGTQYVEFMSAELAGTKCTDDAGVFATILKNPPAETDAATAELEKQLDGDTYALSLPDDTCTSDEALFAQYQAAFRDAFGLLALIESDEAQ